MLNVLVFSTETKVHLRPIRTRQVYACVNNLHVRKFAAPRMMEK